MLNQYISRADKTIETQQKHIVRWAAAFFLLAACIVAAIVVGYLQPLNKVTEKANSFYDQGYDEGFIEGQTFKTDLFGDALHAQFPDGYGVYERGFSTSDFNAADGMLVEEFCDEHGFPFFTILYELYPLWIESEDYAFQFNVVGDVVVAYKRYSIAEYYGLTPSPSPAPLPTPGTGGTSTGSGSGTRSGPANTPIPVTDANMVWIPTHGGKRYHKTNTCSGMQNPKLVTKEEAKAQGFTPCGKCHPGD